MPNRFHATKYSGFKIRCSSKNKVTYRIFSSYVVCLESKKRKKYELNDFNITYVPNYAKYMKLI